MIRIDPTDRLHIRCGDSWAQHMRLGGDNVPPTLVPLEETPTDWPEDESLLLALQALKAAGFDPRIVRVPASQLLPGGDS